MRKSIAIFLLSIYLISFTQFGQILKVPTLVAHFNEHTAENAGMSFWDFMVMHYATKRVFDSDYEKDMKLPFKVIDNLSGSTFLWAAPEVYVLSGATESAIVSSKVAVRSSKLIALGFFSGIWQPPQFC